MSIENLPCAVKWVGSETTGHLEILDQTLLPKEEIHLALNCPEELWDAIKKLKVRGAPAIGIAAAFGMVLEAQRLLGHKPASNLIQNNGFWRGLNGTADYLKGCRPTAVNLAWAVDTVLKDLFGKDPTQILSELFKRANQIAWDDVTTCNTIGAYGATRLPLEGSILTHCNAGAMATSSIGTALAPVYHRKREGQDTHVYVDETRPLLQGSRITAWELNKVGIPHTVLCDNMAASLMASGKVKAVFVGADRITLNGDVANKIGTLGLAVIAGHFGVPFYVLAPTSTICPNTVDGREIPIEMRDKSEVTNILGFRSSPRRSEAYNPAFDVTPNTLITEIITEKGIFLPYEIQKEFGPSRMDK
jgi:methylthioribose-1-phosphate isomerase